MKLKQIILLCFNILGFMTSGFTQSLLDQNNRELLQTYKSQDSLFLHPYVDVDEWRDIPTRHRYVHGGFTGTETRFSYYFPSKENYQGRFFQYITPFPDNENLSQGATGEEDKISFSLSSGAYFIETNGGGRTDFTKPNFTNDPSIGAYRANAAVAQFSRHVAAALYGEHRTYGYAFGGSGGAYRTIGGIENTEGVWDGVVPYVPGSPMAIPNVFSVRMHAMRILYPKFPQIIDAVEPGGSGNVYAGLNTEETDALREVTAMGFPPQSWFGYRTMGVHGFVAVYQGVVMADRSYFEDFWKTPGYLGAQPPPSLAKARLQLLTQITQPVSIDEAVQLKLSEPQSARERGTADQAWKSIGGAVGQIPVAYRINADIADVNFLGGDLIIKSGAAAGKTLQLTKAVGHYVVLGPADPAVLALLKPGDQVQVDNSNFLAAQTYHRHQVPGPEYSAWNQFRNTAGKPLYPQRPMLLGPLFTQGAAGVVPTGKYQGKMILLASLWDREAFAWQADWYKARVQEHQDGQIDQNFRLWYTDRALHGDLTAQEDPTRTVSYLGVLQQALRDLSAWVERGIAPPPSTAYVIKESQVIVPPTAHERRGIQPTVHLKVEGDKAKKIKAGEQVTFSATVAVPQGTGEIVTTEWDFEGSGSFAVTQNKVFFNKKTGIYTLKASYKFNKPGTYFPTLRVTTHREGDHNSPFARIQNLDRVRVIVEN